jgi:hypothetical protein
MRYTKYQEIHSQNMQPVHFTVFLFFPAYKPKVPHFQLKSAMNH